MKIEPIRIDIYDDQLFMRAAFVVDQEGILNLIPQLRKTWKIPKDLIDPNDFNNWYNNWGSLPLTTDLYNSLSTSIDQTEIAKTQGNLDIVTETQRAQSLAYSDFNEMDLDLLFKKIGISKKGNENIILQAIACGVVREQNLGDHKALGKDIAEWVYEYADNKLLSQREYFSDTKSNIRTDREVYLLKKSGLTYKQISELDKMYGKVDPDDLEDKIKKIVRRYRLFLRGTFKVSLRTH